MNEQISENMRRYESTMADYEGGAAMPPGICALREDRVEPSLAQEELLFNSECVCGDCFAAPGRREP